MSISGFWATILYFCLAMRWIHRACSIIMGQWPLIYCSNEIRLTCLPDSDVDCQIKHGMEWKRHTHIGCGRRFGNQLQPWIQRELASTYRMEDRWWASVHNWDKKLHDRPAQESVHINVLTIWEFLQRRCQDLVQNRFPSTRPSTWRAHGDKHSELQSRLDVKQNHDRAWVDEETAFIKKEFIVHSTSVWILDFVFLRGGGSHISGGEIDAFLFLCVFWVIVWGFEILGGIPQEIAGIKHYSCIDRSHVPIYYLGHVCVSGKQLDWLLSSAIKLISDSTDRIVKQKLYNRNYRSQPVPLFISIFYLFVISGATTRVTGDRLPTFKNIYIDGDIHQILFGYPPRYIKPPPTSTWRCAAVCNYWRTFMYQFSPRNIYPCRKCGSMLNRIVYIKMCIIPKTLGRVNPPIIVRPSKNYKSKHLFCNRYSPGSGENWKNSWGVKMTHCCFQG